MERKAPIVLLAMKFSKTDYGDGYDDRLLLLIVSLGGAAVVILFAIAAFKFLG